MRPEENSDNGRSEPAARVRCQASAWQHKCQTRLAQLSALGDDSLESKARRQANLRSGRQVHKDLGDAPPIGLLVLRGEISCGKRTFRIVSANRATFDLTGRRELTAANLAGHTIASLLPCVCENDFAASLLSIIRSGKPEVLGEIHYGEGHGSNQILSVYVFPMRHFFVGIALEKVTRNNRTRRAVR